jgi:hypothetical protein
MQARVQRIEADVHGLYRILAVTDRGDQVRALIKETFADARTCIVFRGVQRGLNGTQTAKALTDRGLDGADKRRVSDTRRQLDEIGLVNKAPKGKYVAAGGLEEFGLDRTIKDTLRKAKVPDID